MTEADAHDPLVFEPPGPGSWTLDPVHFPRPVTRYFSETHPAAFALGVSDFTKFYGMLLDRLDSGYVNGFCYLSMVPVSNEEAPARIARAEEVFKGKLWRDQVREWDETVKPSAIARHRELLAVDPDKLTDEELAAYLSQCQQHHAAMISQHMRFTAAAIVPTGDFLAHLADWTDHPPAELLDLLRGTAPVSAGASDELEALVSALKKDEPTRSRLAESENPAADIEELRRDGSDVGKALGAYIDLVGYRLLDGFDIAETCAIELPDVLLRSVLTAAEAEAAQAHDLDEKISQVRNAVPSKHQRHFDELLAEARHTYRVRDERGVFSDIWASGIMRRAALAAGRRVAGRGRIENPEHFVDAGIAEWPALLGGLEIPSARELADRSAYRKAHRASEAPMLLGPPPPPPPDLSQLPAPAARMMRATDLALGAVFGSSEAEHELDMLRGLAASKGMYEGPARRVSGPADFDRIKRGDVLVTESTSEAFNILLPLLGAIVTDAGGLLSHSAIVAREYGIPGVVGTREATARISDGARVRVDGNAGEVTVLGP